MNAQDYLSGVYLDNAKFTKQEVIELMEQYSDYQKEYRKQLVGKQANGANTKNEQNAVLCGVSVSLPCKDLVVAEGYNIAKNANYNYRRVLREPDHDIYYSGWMDCYDWLIGNER